MSSMSYRLEDILAESDGDDDLDMDVGALTDMDINAILNSKDPDDDDGSNDLARLLAMGSLAEENEEPYYTEPKALTVVAFPSSNFASSSSSNPFYTPQAVSETNEFSPSSSPKQSAAPATFHNAPSSSTPRTPPTNAMPETLGSTSPAHVANVRRSPPTDISPLGAGTPPAASGANGPAYAGTNDLSINFNSDSDDLHEDELIEGSERYNRLLNAVMHESESEDDDFMRTMVSAQDRSALNEHRGTIHDQSLQLAIGNSPKTQTKAARMSSPDRSKLDRAAALEEKMSRLGNYEMVAPLQAKRRLNKQKGSYNLLKVQEKSKIKEELAKYRQHAGLPTAAATHFKFIAVGTFRGVVLVFDHFETLVMALGKFSDTSVRGPVTALDMSLEGDHLVVGHQQGHVVVWDLVSKQEFKVINDSATSPVTSVRFTQQRGRLQFVVVHQDGTVNLFGHTKVFFASTWDKQCLLQGAPPCLTCAVLPSNPHSPHYCDKYNLIALGAEKWTIVVALEPEVKMLTRIPRPPEDLCREGALPLVAWRPVRSHDQAGGQVLKEPRDEPQDVLANPVLAIARGLSVQFIQVSEPETALDATNPKTPLVVFKPAGEYRTEKDEFIGVHWLGGQVLVGITTHQNILVIDPLEVAELASIEMKGVGLIYHEYIDNPATGGKEVAYESGIRGSDESLLLMGVDRIIEANVLSWSERVNALVDKGQWIEALALALDFYEGCAKAAIGLPRSERELKHILADRIVQLLMSYVDLGLGGSRGYAAGRSNQSGNRHLQLIGGVAIDYCVIIERTDILFQDIYLKFVQAGGAGVFLELLEPYILNDKVSYLSPETMKDFVEYYHHQGKVQQVEQCLLHMKIECLDFQQIVVLCRERQLFTALIYIYNKGLNDYCSPLEDTLRVMLSDGLNQSQREQFGYKMLLYIKYCLTGKAFPRGDLPTKKIAGVKAQILAVIFSKQTTLENGRVEGNYPWVRYLMQLDTLEFMDVLSEAFEAEDWQKYLSDERIEESAEEEIPDPATSLPIATAVADSRPTDASAGIIQTNVNNVMDFFVKLGEDQPVVPVQPKIPVANAAATARKGPSDLDLFNAQVRAMTIPSRQEMIDALVSIMIDPLHDPFSQSVPLGGPTKRLKLGSELSDPRNSLYALAPAEELRTVDRLTAVHEFGARYTGREGVKATSLFLNRIFAYLTIGFQGVHSSSYESTSRREKEAALISLLETTDESSYDIETLTMKAKQANFFEACVCLYKKKGDHVRVLECYIKASKENSDRIQPVFEYIASLIRDPEVPIRVKDTIKTATLQRLADLVTASSDGSARLIIECFADENDGVIRALGNSKDLQYQYLRSIMKRERTTDELLSDELDIKELMARSGVQLSPELHELYIRLLCQFNPTEVYSHLTSHQEYNIDSILKLCQMYEIDDASAYLLERTGDSKGALDLTLRSVDKTMGALQEHIEREWSQIALAGNLVDPKQTQPVKNTIDVAILLCERSLQSESLWFTLLDRFFFMQRQLKDEQKRKADTDANRKVYQLMQQCLFSFVRLILSSMMTSVPLPAILRKITTDHLSDELREFRNTIQDMLDTYAYEKNILSIANGLLVGDLFSSLKQRKRVQARAFRTRTKACGMCNLDIGDHGGSMLTLYDCGHAFHEDCLGRSQMQCPTCQQRVVPEGNKFRESVSSQGHKEKGHDGEKDGERVPREQPSASQDSSERETRAAPNLSDSKTKEYIYRLQQAVSLLKHHRLLFTYSLAVS